MIQINFGKYPFRYQTTNNHHQIFDIIRKKFVELTPEEWVRQNLIYYFIESLNYPKNLISVEKEIRVNNLKKRYDIVVFNKDIQPWMLVECKAPDVPINEDVFSQAMSYHSVLQCPYWLLSNGNRNYGAEIKDGKLNWLSGLPFYNF